VLEGDKQHGLALNFASEALQADRDFVMEAVKHRGMALEFASEALRADREVAMEAVKQIGLALAFTSEALQADRDFVMEAVKKDGWSLYYASESLQADREIVLAAVKQDGASLKYANREFWSDREVVLEAVKKCALSVKYNNDQVGFALGFASEALQADREVVLAAVNGCGWVLKFASEALRADREVVLAAVKQAGSALKYASEVLRADREVVVAAFKQDETALEYAGEALQDELKQAIKKGDIMTDYYPYEWKAIHDTNGMPVGEAVYEEKLCDEIFWDGLPLQEAYDSWLNHKHTQETFNGTAQHLRTNEKESAFRTKAWMENKYPLPYRCYKPKAWANQQDILSLDSFVPVVNERVLKILDEICPNEYEAFPIDVEATDGTTTPFFIVNITHCIKGAINLEESRYGVWKGRTEQDKNSLKHVTKLTMNPNCMGDLTLARLYEKPSCLAIHPRLVDRFKSEEIVGMRQYAVMGSFLKGLFHDGY
jgi:hypothetical protein